MLPQVAKQSPHNEIYSEYLSDFSDAKAPLAIVLLIKQTKYLFLPLKSVLSYKGHSWIDSRICQPIATSKSSSSTNITFWESITSRCIPSASICETKSGFRERHRLTQDFDCMRLARESEGYVGVEIEQAIIDAMYVGFNQGREFSTEDISKALKRQVPLSVSQKERIEALRNWLKEGRAQSASFEEIREAQQQFVSLQLDLRS